MRPAIPLNERAEAMLLIEVDGDAGALLSHKPNESQRLAIAQGSIEVVVAQSASQRDRVWAARRTMSPAIRKLSNYKLSEDIVVGSQSIPELFARVERYTAQQNIRWLVYGHAGDGNLHVNYLWDDANDKRNLMPP